MKKYTLKNYVEYMKDNPNKLWFKMKLYGWGWVPVSWQGWLTILFFVGVLIGNGLYLESQVSQTVTPTTSDFLIFYGTLIISIAALILIAYKKGEKPKWNWGLKVKNK